MNRVEVGSKFVAADAADMLQAQDANGRAYVPLPNGLRRDPERTTDGAGAARLDDRAPQRVPHSNLIAHESDKSIAFNLPQARLLWTKGALSPQNTSMSADSGSVLRTARQARGYVMQAVADAIGVSVSAIGQWERGTNSLTMDNLRAVCAFLGIDPVSAHAGRLVYLDANPDLNEVQQVSEPAPSAGGLGPRDVPIEGVALGGQDDDFEFSGGIIDYARRPPGIAALKNVFAVHILGDSMSPRFEPGDLAYCGGRPAMPGDDVVIEMAPLPNDPSRRGYVKRLKQRTAREVVVMQFNPVTELRFNASEVRAVHRIIPWKELLGF